MQGTPDMLTLIALCGGCMRRRTLGLQECDLLDVLRCCSRGALSMLLLIGSRLQARLLDLHPV